MPRGTRHVVRGRLRLDDRGYWLDVEGGGTWALHVSRGRARRLVGADVVIDGTRWGFDLLEVHQIWRYGEPRPKSVLERIARVICRS